MTQQSYSCAYNHTPLFIALLFRIAQAWKQLKCPSTDEKRKKMWYNTMGYYSPIKKTTNNGICRNMDATRGYHTK